MMQLAARSALLLVFAITATVARPVIAADKGLLVIEVEVGMLKSDGSDVRSLIPLARYDVMNLTTREVYAINNAFRFDYAAAEEVDEGIYCLYSLKITDNGLGLPYCGEPYFKVVGGRVNNAGLWRYGISDRDNEQRLIFGAHSFESILDEAKKYHKEALRKYGMHLQD